MLKILKYLKDAKWTVLLIIALLVVQAVCELALPSYTADIVDVGITRGGIEDIAPTVMRPDTLDALCLFMTDGDEAMVRASYAPDADGNMARQTKDRETIDALGEAFAIPMASLYGIATGGMGAAQGAENTGAEADPQAAMMAQFKQSLAGDVADVPAKLMAPVRSGMMTGEMMRERIAALRAQAAGAAAVSDDTTELTADRRMLIEQTAIAFTKAEYTALGRNMESIQTNYMLLIGAKMLGVTLAMVVAAILAGLLAARTAAKVGMDLRGKVFKKVLSFSSGDIEKFSTASLITRSTTDIQRVAMSMVMLLRMVAYSPILGIGGVLKVIATKTGMGWIIFVAVGALLVLVGFLMIVAMPRFRKMPVLIDHVNLVAREILTGIMPIRAFSREQHENERFAVANTNLMRNQLFVNRTMSLMMPIMMLIMNGITVMIIWFGAKGVDLGNLQVGDMMAFITYTMQIVMSFLMLAMVSIMLPNAIVSAGRIDEVLNTPVSVSDREDARDDQKTHWDGVVAFEDVSFRYPDAEKEVLEHITFTAKPGQTTAILGGTGSGKSTLLNLIPRFYDVTEGRVTLDGVDIRDLTQKKLRSLLGYVPQKGVLFSGNIESNLKFGGDDITDEAMIEAAEIAQAKTFIEEKDEGFGSAIAQGGTNVSGGQRQRLSIARALARKPKVLLFDDSFSALDYRTDASLRRALKERASDATVIVVAQRISTVLHADQIIVLEEGRMVGLGTHEELMATSQAYQEIARSQLSEAELSGRKEA